VHFHNKPNMTHATQRLRRRQHPADQATVLIQPVRLAWNVGRRRREHVTLLLVVIGLAAAAMLGSSDVRHGRHRRRGALVCGHAGRKIFKKINTRCKRILRIRHAIGARNEETENVGRSRIDREHHQANSAAQTQITGLQRLARCAQGEAARQDCPAITGSFRAAAAGRCAFG
jgi:hypothetical protein